MSLIRREVELMRKITTIDTAVNPFNNPKRKVAAFVRVSKSSEEQLISLEAQKKPFKIL